jgi:hypothetical protein
MTRVESARAQLTHLLEMYTPSGAIREVALQRLHEGVKQFELAVREEEHTLVKASELFKDSEEAIRADERTKVLAGIEGVPGRVHVATVPLTDLRSPVAEEAPTIPPADVTNVTTPADPAHRPAPQAAEVPKAGKRK